MSIHGDKSFEIGLKLHLGQSGVLAGEPDEDSVGPEDLARTMYRLIGINSKRIVVEGVRPVDNMNGGRLISELIA